MQFRKWTNRATELSASEPSIAENALPSAKLLQTFIADSFKPQALKHSSNDCLSPVEPKISNCAKAVDSENYSTTNWANYVLKACLLCQRQFDNDHFLNRHLESSLLHKSNLERYRMLEAIHQKCPRATEPNALRYAEMNAEVTVVEMDKPEKTSEKKKELPLDNSNNIGAKMLLKMGWKKGEGLGKDRKGITEPIKVGRPLVKILLLVGFD